MKLNEAYALGYNDATNQLDSREDWISLQQETDMKDNRLPWQDKPNYEEEPVLFGMGQAPTNKITIADIEREIVAEHYVTGGLLAAVTTAVMGPAFRPQQSYHKALDRLTICVLVLRNGFTVVGESACVAIENFDEAVGRKLARGKAFDKLWPIIGYQLREAVYLREQLPQTEHVPKDVEQIAADVLNKDADKLSE